MKKLASENFKIKSLKFLDFDYIKATEFASLSIDEDGEQEEAEDTHELEVWADMSLSYEGTPPQSYRTLNAMIMDYVDDNEDKIKKEINPKLKSFLEKEYPDVDTSDLDEDFDDYIWEDQVDYLPEINESDKDITFSIELVLDVEDVESEDK
jgi:hypothetical protein